MTTSADENDTAASQMVPDDQLPTEKQELRAQYRQFLFQQNRVEDPRLAYDKE